MAEFDPEKRLSLLDMVRLENLLADILDVRLDLAPVRAMKGPIRERANREAVLAF
jgi:predicted nucleotidyltransferase